jgi:ferredoxin-type protein NapH
MAAQKLRVTRQTLGFPLAFFAAFVLIGVWRWQATGSPFYLYNFTYIGGSVALGIFLNDALTTPYKPWGRRVALLLVGLYMLGFVGLASHENMQLEGFFFYVFQGVFAGATLHYVIAKIVGPFVFGRAWCGWACWTAMALDLLPWQRPARGRVRRAGLIRCIHFFLSLGLVSILFVVMRYRQPRQDEIAWLIAGNLLYYAIALILAARLRDNRAFCKYVCPIPTMQKLGARFALLKLAIDSEKCIRCGRCEAQCPMGIKILEYADANQRVLSSECILCNTCVNVCSTHAIRLSAGFDAGWRERLKFAEKA